MEALLPEIWLLIIGFFLLYYAITDGFDLGVGVISLTERDPKERLDMMSTLTSIWHINQTWLVVLGGILFGAFPLFYSVVFTALYIPIFVMLFGFIFRGIAFDFSEHSQNDRFWTLNFGLGSFLITLAQGFALGALLGGLNIRNGQFAGGVWDWFTPFSCLVAVGVLFGYIMLGANYLIVKTQGYIQQRSFRYSLASASVTIVVSITVYIWIILSNPHSLEKWLSLSDVWIIALFPVLALVAFGMFFRSLKKRKNLPGPLLWNAAIIVFSFTGLSITMYPNMIPNVISPITVTQAATSPTTLKFMLVVMVAVIPVILFYTTYTYRVFRGKSGENSDDGA